MPELTDACCKKVASMARGKTPEELRKLFNIPTPETEVNAMEDSVFDVEDDMQDE